MWENETVVLVTSLKKRILNGKGGIRIGKITSDEGIPEYIKLYFKDKVEEFITAEKPVTVQSTPHFRIKPEELDTLRNRFYNVFREAASFNAQDVEDILQEALVLRIKYLIKPVDTMRRRLFEDRKQVQCVELPFHFNAFQNMLPYSDSLIEIVKQQGSETIESSDFNQLASRVVHELTEKDPLRRVMTDLSVLTDFLSESRGEEVTRLDGETLQNMMTDRDLIGFRRAVDVEIKLGKNEFTASELEMTLKRYLELREEFSSQNSQAPAVLPVGKENDKEKVEKEKEPEPVNEIDLDVALDLSTETVEEKSQEVEREKEELSKSVEEENKEEVKWNLDEALDQESEPEEKAAIEKAAGMRIIRRKENGKEEKPEKVAQPKKAVTRQGLNELVDAKMKKGFVKKLFSGDEKEYEALMDKLDQSESWRVAKILIDNELFKRDVDPFSREAIKLVDLVYSIYYPDEGVGGI